MSKPQLVRQGEGTDFAYSQDHCFVKLPSSATSGRLSMVEDTLKPGFELGRHHHQRMTEVFTILEGKVEFEFDDDAIVLQAGDTLTIPPKGWHAARCQDGGRLLTVFMDGKFDEYLERLSSMTDEQFQDATLMQAVSEEFDIYSG